MTRSFAVVCGLSSLVLGGCLFGGSDDGPEKSFTTNDALCDVLTADVCAASIRCETWAGTQEDCVRAAKYECCRGEACDYPAGGTVEDARDCIARVRGISCTYLASLDTAECFDMLGTEPLSSPVTSDLDDDRAGVDDDRGGVVMGPPSTENAQYETCPYAGSTCADEACYDVGYTPICTRRCNDDYGCDQDATCFERSDSASVCVKLCTGDADCPLTQLCQEGAHVTDVRFEGEFGYCR